MSLLGESLIESDVSINKIHNEEKDFLHNISSLLRISGDEESFQDDLDCSSSSEHHEHNANKKLDNKNDRNIDKRSNTQKHETQRNMQFASEKQGKLSKKIHDNYNMPISNTHQDPRYTNTNPRAYSFIPVMNYYNNRLPTIPIQNQYSMYPVPVYSNEFNPQLYYNSNFHSAYQLQNNYVPAYAVSSPCLIQPVIIKSGKNLNSSTKACVKGSLSTSNNMSLKQNIKSSDNISVPANKSKANPPKIERFAQNESSKSVIKEKLKETDTQPPFLESNFDIEFTEFNNLNLTDYLCTQKGCRYFQNHIYSASPKIVDQIIRKIGNKFHIVMTDLYANYFFQKLITCCSQLQRVSILNYISNKFYYISNNTSGTHAIQTLYELVTTPEEILIISNSLYSEFVETCKGDYSNHTIQKLITVIPESNRPLINEYIIKNVDVLMYDPHGICILKKFLAEASTDMPYRRIWSYIKPICFETITDFYGNYIIQLFLEVGLYKDISSTIIATVILHLDILVSHKVGSNVVERCIEYSDEEEKMKLLIGLFNSLKEPDCLDNKYSKYVIKKAISCMTIEQIEVIVKQIESYWNDLDLKVRKKLNTIIERMLVKKNTSI